MRMSFGLARVGGGLASFNNDGLAVGSDQQNTILI